MCMCVCLCVLGVVCDVCACLRCVYVMCVRV